MEQHKSSDDQPDSDNSLPVIVGNIDDILKKFEAIKKRSDDQPDSDNSLPVIVGNIDDILKKFEAIKKRSDVVNKDELIRMHNRFELGKVLNNIVEMHSDKVGAWYVPEKAIIGLVDHDIEESVNKSPIPKFEKLIDDRSKSPIPQQDDSNVVSFDEFKSSLFARNSSVEWNFRHSDLIDDDKPEVLRDPELEPVVEVMEHEPIVDNDNDLMRQFGISNDEYEAQIREFRMFESKKNRKAKIEPIGPKKEAYRPKKYEQVIFEKRRSRSPKSPSQQEDDGEEPEPEPEINRGQMKDKELEEEPEIRQKRSKSPKFPNERNYDEYLKNRGRSPMRHKDRQEVYPKSSIVEEPFFSRKTARPRRSF